MHGVSAARFTPNFDLASSDRAIAQDADAPVIQRMPFAAHVGPLEDRELFFWWQSFHVGTR
jgi:hypothetical protein